MKKTAAALLAAALLLPLAACTGQQAPGAQPVSLYEKGRELTVQMGSLAKNGPYLSLFSVNGRLLETAGEIGAQAYDAPQAVYEVTGLADALLKQYGETGQAAPDQETLALARPRFAAAAATQISAQSGAEFLAAVSVLTAEDFFLDAGLTEPKTYLYLYDGPYGSMVLFYPYEDGIVRATANIVPLSFFAEAGSAEEVAARFADGLGLADVSVRPAQP